MKRLIKTTIRRGVIATTVFGCVGIIGFVWKKAGDPVDQHPAFANEFGRA